MATKVFNEGLKQLFAVDIDAATIKALLLMTNTTVDTEDDGKAASGDFTTLDEANGANYARQTLAGVTISKDDATDTAKVTCTSPITFAALGNGSRNIAGVLIVIDESGTLRPVSWHEFATPRVADGTDFLVEIRSDTGLIKASKA